MSSHDLGAAGQQAAFAEPRLDGFTNAERPRPNTYSVQRSAGNRAGRDPAVSSNTAIVAIAALFGGFYLAGTTKIDFMTGQTSNLYLEFVPPLIVASIAGIVVVQRIANRNRTK